MTEYVIPLYIEDKILNTYRKLMGPGPIDYPARQIPQYGTVDTWTIEFPDKTTMDIKLCAGDHENRDPLWAQGIFYNDTGVQDALTDIKDTLETEFTVHRNDDDYTLHTVYTVKILPESKRPA